MSWMARNRASTCSLRAGGACAVDGRVVVQEGEPGAPKVVRAFDISFPFLPGEMVDNASEGSPSA
eukprot:6872914-Pyramimonas_sp.AAC.1